MDEANTTSGRVIKDLELIRSLLHPHLEEGKSFSLWRLPGETEKNIIICSRVIEIQPDQLSVEDSKPGFIVSPFAQSKNKWFLPADIHLKISNGEVRQLTGEQIAEPVLSSKKLKIHLTPVSSASATSSLNTYQKLVADCVKEIEAGTFQKAVPSRRQSFPISDDVNIMDVFDRLCERHPQALITLVSAPEFGTWMGASPELLVHVSKNSIFKTSALASTQVYQPGTDLKAVLWNQKEIEEQALVSRYIINSCFKKIRLREFEEEGPRTFRAGNLLHLRTDFKVDMVATDFLQLGTIMLKLLHPTSAVCGMPMKPALDFLEKNEGYDRELYTGYWGPVNVDGETNIYVNLRCMRAGNDEAFLYAGAGVTIDSDPQLEWEETINKMNTLRQVIVP